MLEQSKQSLKHLDEAGITLIEVLQGVMEVFLAWAVASEGARVLGRQTT